MPQEEQNPLTSVLSKIPIFAGLETRQVRRILGICKPRSLGPGDELIRNDSEADEMFVLVSGELAVIADEGAKVARLLPVTTVGEMGVITGAKRVATVVAAKASSVLAIGKHPFDLALREDQEMQVMVLRNIVNVLGQKLDNDNKRMRGHEQLKIRQSERLEGLETQMQEAEARVERGMEVAVASGDLTRDEIQLYIDEQIKDLVRRLLVVDDDPNFRRLVRDALSNYEVLEAGDGDEALNILQQESVDLVLSDIAMPGMDGFELLEAVREQFPQLAVVAVSGFTDAEKAEDFDDFLAKPPTIEELREMVEDNLPLDES